MLIIFCKFELTVWKKLAEEVAVHIAKLQIALQQQEIWVEVGSNGEAINTLPPEATSVFPQQDEFKVKDEKVITEIAEELKQKPPKPIESIADVVTGSTDGKIFEKEMSNFKSLCKNLQEILENLLQEP